MSSCASQPCVYSPVILPVEVSYKSISGERLSCLDQETYTDLVVNSETCKAQNRTLRALIQEHNKIAQ